MNLASLYIGMGVLLACILPFYIGYLRRKKRQNKEMSDFLAHGLKYGIEITEVDSLKDAMIGCDPIKRKVLYRKIQNNETDETLLDFEQIKNCILVKKERSDSVGNKVIDTIHLEFTAKSNNHIPTIKFFDCEENMTLFFELQLAEKWRNLINDLLVKK